jgi:hypothetical protein
MLQLSLQSAGDDKATMLIDYQSESIGLTVIHGGQQLDFSIEKDEWESFKGFIEKAMEIDSQTQNKRG